MLPSIPSEAAYAQWLVACIQKYFEALGFDFYPEVQSQQYENDFPFDIYAEISKGNIVKRFGLQVKRPYTARPDIYWVLDSSQHSQLKKFNWIYYSFPDFLTRQYYKNACYHTMFKDTNFPFVSHLHKSKIGLYYRMGAFANRIIACNIGQTLSEAFDWVKSGIIFKEFDFSNQFHTYLDFIEKKGQIFTNIKAEGEEKTE